MRCTPNHDPNSLVEGYLYKKTRKQMPDFNTLKSGIQLSTPESLGIKGLWSLEPFQHQPLIITVPAFVEGLGCLRHCQNHSYD